MALRLLQGKRPVFSPDLFNLIDKLKNELIDLNLLDGFHNYFSNKNVYLLDNEKNIFTSYIDNTDDVDHNYIIYDEYSNYVNAFRGDSEDIVYDDKNQYIDGSDDEPGNRDPLIAEKPEERANYGAREEVNLFVCIDVTDFSGFLLSSSGNSERNIRIFRSFWDPAIEILRRYNDIIHYSKCINNSFVQFVVRTEAKKATRVLYPLLLQLANAVRDRFDEAVQLYEQHSLSFRVSVSGAGVDLDDDNSPFGFGLLHATKMIRNKNLFTGKGKCEHYSICDNKNCDDIKYSSDIYSKEAHMPIVMDGYAYDKIMNKTTPLKKFCENISCTKFHGSIYRLSISIG